VICFSTLYSLPVLWFAGKKMSVGRLRLWNDLGSSWKLIALLAGCLLLNLYFYFTAIRMTSIANAVFTHYTAPIFVALLAPLTIAEPIDRYTIAALLLSLGGLFLLLFPGLDMPFTRRDQLGIGAGLMSGLTYACTLLTAKRLTGEIPPLSIAFWQGVFMVAIMLPILLISGAGITALRSFWFTFMLLGLLHCSIAPLLYVGALRQVKAQHAAIIGYLEPVGTIIMGILILKEIPPAVVFAGGILIFSAGLLVVTRGVRQHV
jgi:drug/metabolite transporter (DMT)-like permease